MIFLVFGGIIHLLFCHFSLILPSAQYCLLFLYLKIPPQKMDLFILFHFIYLIFVKVIWESFCHLLRAHGVTLCFWLFVFYGCVFEVYMHCSLLFTQLVWQLLLVMGLFCLLNVCRFFVIWVFRWKFWVFWIFFFWNLLNLALSFNQINFKLNIVFESIGLWENSCAFALAFIIWAWLDKLQINLWNLFFFVTACLRFRFNIIAEKIFLFFFETFLSISFFSLLQKLWLDLLGKFSVDLINTNLVICFIFMWVSVIEKYLLWKRFGSFVIIDRKLILFRISLILLKLLRIMIISVMISWCGLFMFLPII